MNPIISYPAASQPEIQGEGEAGETFLDNAIQAQAAAIEWALAQMHHEQEHREAGHHYCGWCKRWFDDSGRYMRGWVEGRSTGICRECADGLLKQTKCNQRN